MCVQSRGQTHMWFGHEQGTQNLANPRQDTISAGATPDFINMHKPACCLGLVYLHVLLPLLLLLRLLLPLLCLLLQLPFQRLKGIHGCVNHLPLLHGLVFRQQ